MKRFAALTTIAAMLAAMFMAPDTAAQSRRYKFVNGQWTEIIEQESDAPGVQEFSETIDADSIPMILILPADTTLNVDTRVFPAHFYLPTVFDEYDIHLTPDSIKANPEVNAQSPLAWVNDIVDTNNRFRRFKQSYMVQNPHSVRYNINTLPVAPKKYHAFVDPSSTSITVEEISIDHNEVRKEVKPEEVKKIHWLNQFDGIVQFSQAYVSPNWYQGGNNNLNMLVNGVYNIKLNQAFHPNLLFDNTISYKLGINNAPDDEFRNYSISEDLFQVNSKFGVKAAHRWYYSATMQFKTQLLNNYVKNSNEVKAAFLAPGELNVGLGMTYDYTSKNGKFSFNASIAPFSYNLKMCFDKRVNGAAFGIPNGKCTESQYGSNIDTKITWKIAYNISYWSRLTAFTDYSYLQSDWEHTLSFTINKYLSTQIYVHMRYDTQTRHIPDSSWQKFQCKEILSFGFAYKIGTI